MRVQFDKLREIAKGETHMKEGWKQWFKEKGMEKWLQRDNLIILVLAGILLFIIALPTKSNEKITDEKQSGGSKTSALLEEQDNLYENGNLLTSELYANTGFSEDEYRKKLEKELAEILENTYGVGKVRTMITLANSPEIVIEKDNRYSRSQTNETDSEGGSRITTQMEEQESTIYKTEGNSSVPYVVKTTFPKVRGVVVVAQGAGKGSVDKNITEVVQALFDLEANEVKVVKMQETN